ncbi:nucleotidyltransferase domain-containing protein [Candidatus Woesearchaeota archaeon]|nr:nucleotidyltransferase domain-containing protein [Candidatus Woesearchaeota archaeon]
MLSHYIQKAEEVLETKFGIKPERSKIYCHENWESFARANGLSVYGESVFFPKDLSAHLPEGNLDKILPLVYHELEGHGNYCEHTIQGRKLVEDEKTFSQLEGDVKVKFAYECSAYFQMIKPYFEGFAMWMEEFLLKSVGREDLWLGRKEKSKRMPIDCQHSYFDAYSMLKKFEEEKGTYELWYSIGFPKRFDKKTLTSIAKEKLAERFNSLEFLILGGSKKPYSDIDLCAILKDGAKTDEYNHSRVIDLVQYNLSDFEKHIEHFEVFATEPILSGELVTGDEKKFKSLKKRVENKSPDPSVCKNLSRKGIRLLENSKKYFEFGDFANSIVSLAYALSYETFAKAYLSGSKVMTYKEVLELRKNHLLNDVYNYQKDLEHGRISFDKGILLGYINQVSGGIAK